MTTFIWSGNLVQVSEATGAITYSETRLKLVAPWTDKDISYSIKQDYPGEQFFPDVKLNLFTRYQFTLDGQEMDPNPAFDATWEIGQATWSGGSGVFLIWYDWDSPDSHIFRLSGSELPQFLSVSDVVSFQSQVSYYNTVQSGPYMPDTPFELQGLADMKVRERDRIVGDDGRDIFYGGAGSDVIRGLGGDDRLDGGDRHDLIDGGKGNDQLTGGTGRDVFVFGRGHRDRITDFEDNVDTIRLDDRLWDGDLGRGAILRKFATVVDGNVVLDFGRHELTLEGFADIDALKNDLEIV